MNKFIVREGTVDDIQYVVDLFLSYCQLTLGLPKDEVYKTINKHFPERVFLLSEKSFKNALEKEDSSLFFVVEYMGEIAGFAFVVVVNDNLARIDAFYIQELENKTHMGQSLLNTIENRIFDTEIKGVFLTEEAMHIPFFTNSGYSVVSFNKKVNEKAFYIIYKDRLLDVNTILKKSLKLLDQGQYCEAKKTLSVVLERMRDVAEGIFDFSSIISLNELLEMLCTVGQYKKV